MNFAWYKYYGRLFHMSAREVKSTPLGEMDDLISCHLIANGMATAKRKPVVTLNDVPDIN